MHIIRSTKPEQAQYVLDRCSAVDGFDGASSIERLPAKRAITDRTREFGGLLLPSR